MSNQMTQCVLERTHNNNHSILTAWIDSEHATVGKHVELLPEGQWWVVAKVGNTQPASVIKEQERLNRKGMPSIRETKKG